MDITITITADEYIILSNLFSSGRGRGLIRGVTNKTTPEKSSGTVDVQEGLTLLVKGMAAKGAKRIKPDIVEKDTIIKEKKSK